MSPDQMTTPTLPLVTSSSPRLTAAADRAAQVVKIFKTPAGEFTALKDINLTFTRASLSASWASRAAANRP